MLLAIDSGNTNILFAVFDDGGEVLGEGGGRRRNSAGDVYFAAE